MFKVVFTDNAVKDLNKLDKQIQKRILSKILHYTSATNLIGAKKLTNSKIGEYRFRVGDYRILFDLDLSKIIILKIAHRKDIYQDL